eukprot:gene12603-15829_t
MGLFSSERYLDEGSFFREEESYEHEHDHSLPHLFRLFVGWVPKHYTEAQLQEIFEEFGKVEDLFILKDKVSGQPRGCAFVSYGTEEEAERAVNKLHGQIRLPGAALHLEVRFARFHHYIQAGAGGGNNRQLFFSNACSTKSEADLISFFEQFGSVEEINIFHNNRTGLSKGCGFVMMMTREMAIATIKELGEPSSADGDMDQHPKPPSTGITVKWADPQLQMKKKKAVEAVKAEDRMVFFAKVSSTASEEEVKGVFSNFGKVQDVNLFRAFQGSPTTKGCGLVTMETHKGALKAIHELDGICVWKGMTLPMVVKWMDGALQRRRRDLHLATLRQGQLKDSRGLLMPGTTPPRVGMMPPHMCSETLPAFASCSQHAPGMPLLSNEIELPGEMLHDSGDEVSEVPPPGCAADTFKLFVGSIPPSYTEDQLRPIFEAIGPVIELIIVRDKVYHKSKGSAFVWYANRALAEQAIQQYNLRHILTDPNNKQDRPLVVRKAKARPAKGPRTQNFQTPEQLALQMPGDHQPHFLTKEELANAHASTSRTFHSCPGQAQLYILGGSLPAGNVELTRTGSKLTQNWPAGNIELTQNWLNFPAVDAELTRTDSKLPDLYDQQNMMSLLERDTGLQGDYLDGMQGMGMLEGAAPVGYGTVSGFSDSLQNLRVSNLGMFSEDHQAPIQGLHPSVSSAISGTLPVVSMASQTYSYNSSLRGLMQIGNGMMQTGIGSGLIHIGDLAPQTVEPPAHVLGYNNMMASMDSNAPRMLNIILNRQQLYFLNAHLTDIQAMSGAKLQITYAPDGVINLVVGGRAALVENARGLVSTLLTQGGLM